MFITIMSHTNTKSTIVLLVWNIIWLSFIPTVYHLVSSQYFINVCSPAHSLHHVCDQKVRDTRARLLCQVKSILQLLYGTDSTSTSLPLLLQLKTKQMRT